MSKKEYCKLSSGAATSCWIPCDCDITAGCKEISGSRASGEAQKEWGDISPVIKKEKAQVNFSVEATSEGWEQTKRLADPAFMRSSLSSGFSHEFHGKASSSPVVRSVLIQIERGVNKNQVIEDLVRMLESSLADSLPEDMKNKIKHYQDKELLKSVPDHIKQKMKNNQDNKL